MGKRKAEALEADGIGDVSAAAPSATKRAYSGKDAEPGACPCPSPRARQVDPPACLARKGAMAHACRPQAVG